MTKPRDLANSVNATSIPGTRLENDAITANKMAPNSVDSSELANDAVSTSKIQNSAITTAKVANAAVTNAKLAFDGGPLSGFRNLIINGNPLINQRAYVSGAATGGANEYTLDRWRVVTSGQDLTFSTTAGICTATAPAGGAEQVIEGASILGGTYVLNWTGTATATVDGNAVAKGGTVTLTGGTNATVRLIDGTFTKVQLEPGSVATPFEERPVGVELQLCQRYYEEVWCQWATSWSASMNNHSAKYKVTKRAAPTLTVYADTTAYAKTGTVANVRNTTGSADIAVGSLLTEASVDGFAIDYATGTASAINMRATVVASIEL